MGALTLALGRLTDLTLPANLPTAFAFPLKLLFIALLLLGDILPIELLDALSYIDNRELPAGSLCIRRTLIRSCWSSGLLPVSSILPLAGSGIST